MFYRLRIAIFLFVGLLLFALLNTIYQGINTLDRLEVVERERDLWQRPGEIIQALNLREGAVVVDLGSGAGYFALKLSSEVGKRGRVLAVDLRKLSLSFLWIRSLLRNQHNVTVILGDTDDPHVPGTVDGVLVVNTYHELTNPKSVLDHLRQSLVSGGRLVIADRAGAGHGIPLESVEQQVRQGGFEVVRRQNRFLDQPGEGPWWLMVAQKP